MTKNVRPKTAARVSKRRRFTDEFRREAVQMMLDGHSAASVAQRLGISKCHAPLPLEATTTSPGWVRRLLAL